VRTEITHVFEDNVGLTIDVPDEPEVVKPAASLSVLELHPPD
jgi:hypothetical protein